jgi:hypothetical protein
MMERARESLGVGWNLVGGIENKSEKQEKRYKGLAKGYNQVLKKWIKRKHSEGNKRFI